MVDLDPSERHEPGCEPVRIHEPVLLAATLEVLALSPGLVVVDGTVGAFGHGQAIVKAIGPSGTYIGMDRDAEILALARQAVSREASASRLGARIQLFHRPFSQLRETLAQLDLGSCDRVFLDLGVSSLQLDRPERGFSFMHDAALDMRMDASAKGTAAEWLGRASERDIESALRDYGEERFARRIARSLVQARQGGGLQRTGQLVGAVLRALPASARHGRIHAATRTFQAIRIAVNDEIGELQRGLAAAASSLAPGGRLAVITFHSVEDRLVKHFMRAQLEPATRKPIVAEAAECARNPRARSAKLRCALKPMTPRGDA